VCVVSKIIARRFLPIMFGAVPNFFHTRLFHPKNYKKVFFQKKKKIH
jgi:hypothetical protein